MTETRNLYEWADHLDKLLNWEQPRFADLPIEDQILRMRQITKVTLHMRDRFQAVMDALEGDYILVVLALKHITQRARAAMAKTELFDPNHPVPEFAEKTLQIAWLACVRMLALLRNEIVLESESAQEEALLLSSLPEEQPEEPWLEPLTVGTPGARPAGFGPPPWIGRAR